MKNLNPQIFGKNSDFRRLDTPYNNKKTRILFFVVILLSTFFMMYKLNENTHFTSDDYRYHYMYESFMPTDNVKRISSLEDIVPSMYNHYNIWGGRITAHVFVQALLLFGKPVFNILNSIAFVFLAVLIYLHCNSFKNLKPSLMLGIVLMLWFFIPQFGASILWVSGAGNYLWCSIIILMFLLPYRLYIESDKYFKDNYINMIIMFLVGIIAGWTNENSGGAMILIQILFIGYFILEGIKLPKWSISGIISSVIGFALLVLAPGNYIRPNKPKALGVKLSELAVNSYETMFIPLLVLIILTIIFINKNNRNKIKELIIPLIYFVASIAGVVVLIVPPYAPQRTWFGPIILIIISIGYIYSKLDFNNNTIKQISTVCIVLFTCSFIYEYGEAYIDITKTYNQVISQVNLIEKEKANGKEDIVIRKFAKPKSDYNAFKHTANISKDKYSWFNSWMAKYYGVDYISSSN